LEPLEGENLLLVWLQSDAVKSEEEEKISKVKEIPAHEVLMSIKHENQNVIIWFFYTYVVGEVVRVQFSIRNHLNSTLATSDEEGVVVELLREEVSFISYRGHEMQ